MHFFQNESELLGQTIRVTLAKPERVKEGSSRPGMLGQPQILRHVLNCDLFCIFIPVFCCDGNIYLSRERCILEKRMHYLHGNKEFEILSKARGFIPLKVLLRDIDCVLPALTGAGASS